MLRSPTTVYACVPVFSFFLLPFPPILVVCPLQHLTTLNPSDIGQLLYKLLDSEADLVKGEERAFSTC